MPARVFCLTMTDAIPTIHIPFSSYFFTDSIMEDLATNTNKYAEIQRNHFISQYPEKRQRSWKPCTAADIRILFGLWIYMGINKLPSGRDQ